MRETDKGGAYNENLFFLGEDINSLVKILRKRESGEQPEVADTVREIINEVRTRGDKALFDFTERFDGVRLKSLEVSRRLRKRHMTRWNPPFVQQ